MDKSLPKWTKVPPTPVDQSGPKLAKFYQSELSQGGSLTDRATRLVNRPVVAGAVLQIPSTFINSLIH